MIPGLKERKPIEIPFGNGCNFIVHIPVSFYTMDEADDICKDLRQRGYHCGVIYEYRHLGNGKRYIGQTMCPRKRHIAHLNSIHSHKRNSAWHKALKKYGMAWFNYDILEIVSDLDEQYLHELLDERETYFIKSRSSSVRKYGYNVAPGGTKRPSKTTVEKPVDMFDLEGNYIKTFTSLTKASAEFGFSGPTIRKVCNHVQHVAGNHLWAWHGKTPIIPPTKKQIYAYDEDGRYYAEYNNAHDASKKLGCSCVAIYNALKDKHRLGNGMYWRDYEVEQIPLYDFPKAVYAYDCNGKFVKGFINLAKAKEFTGDSQSSSISHAIIRKTAHKGYLWRTEYYESIDLTNGRFINKAPVIAIFPNGSQKQYEMIKDAASDNGITTSSVQHSIKYATKTASGLQFVRVNCKNDKTCK